MLWNTLRARVPMPVRWPPGLRVTHSSAPGQHSARAQGTQGMSSPGEGSASSGVQRARLLERL